MDAKTKLYFRWTAYAIGLGVVILEIFRIMIVATDLLTDPDLFNTSLSNVIRYSESILVSLGAISIRISMDTEIVKAIILETDIEEESSEKRLNSSLFINLMPIAMIICTVSDFILGEIDPEVIGIGSFLIAQVLLIIAFSGLIHYIKAFTGKIQILAIISTLVLVVTTFVFYFLLIFSAEDMLSMIVIVYMLCILIMCLGTYFNLGYVGRDIKFRLMLCIGGTSFLISDTIIGINMFNDHIPVPGVWVLLTYIIANLCLQYAVLFLRKKK